MIVLVDERAFDAAQRVGLILFLGFTVVHSLTESSAFGFAGLVFAVVVVVFSARPDGLVKMVRGIGKGLAEVGLISLFLDLVGLKVPFIGSETAYWISLSGLLLNIVLIVFEKG